MTIDDRVRVRYELSDEDARLWRPGIGQLVRLRTWDIFARFLPARGRVLDLGGGPGTHAAWLARQGHTVRLVDPIDRHLALARERSLAQPEAPFAVKAGSASEIDAADGAFDAVVMMGPLYHLVDRTERVAALREARRVLRPGGMLVAEVITRYSWLLDATLKGLLGDETTWATIEHSVATGRSQPDGPELKPGAFWAYFHRQDDLQSELAEAGFTSPTRVGVEGFGWLLGDLEQRLLEPEPLLRGLRLCESEPSMLGMSAHVMAIARRS